MRAVGQFSALTLQKVAILKHPKLHAYVGLISSATYLHCDSFIHIE